MSLSYRNFPFIQFCILCDDESKLSEFNIDKSDWDAIKEEYNDNNPSDETITIVEAYKKAVKANIERNKFLAVMKYILSVESDNWQPYFEAANIKFSGDFEKDNSYLTKMIEKESTKEEIFTAQLDKLQDDITKSRKKQNESQPKFNVKKIYKTIATLVKVGAPIQRYEELTCGEYEALTEVYSEKNGK